MALTLEEALGHPIESIDDAFRAHIMFPVVKHQISEDTDETINNMNNVQLLEYLSLAQETLTEKE